MRRNVVAVDNDLDVLESNIEKTDQDITSIS